MPSSDYSNVVGGGLKLKGAKDAGVKKKKKKEKKEKTSSDKPSMEKDNDSSTAMQKALADEEDDDKALQRPADAEIKQYGKTEAQKRHEEMRRKRVLLILSPQTAPSN